MRRREVIALIAGATAAWPLVARTETSRRVGFLFTPSAQAAKAIGSLEAIVQGLKEHGWIEGQNITFEYRYADGKQDALPKLAAELVRLRVDAIVAEGTPAMQAATQTVPIVGLSNDPLASGFVSSLGRPSGNITGIGLLSADLAGRRLQLLSEVVVGLARVVKAQSTAAVSCRYPRIRLKTASPFSSQTTASPSSRHERTGSTVTAATICGKRFEKLVPFLVSSRTRPSARWAMMRTIVLDIVNPARASGEGSISKIESRSDMLLSTLRSYVEAMGGSLRLVAEFPDGVAELSSLGEAVDITPERGTKSRSRPQAKRRQPQLVHAND